VALFHPPTGDENGLIFSSDNIYYEDEIENNASRRTSFASPKSSPKGKKGVKLSNASPTRSPGKSVPAIVSRRRSDLVTQLDNNCPENRGPICLEVDAAKLVERLQKAGIFTSLRTGKIRVSLYLYNTHDDVIRLVRSLRNYLLELSMITP